VNEVVTGSPRDVADAYLAALSRHDFGALEQVVAADYRHHSNGVDFDFPGLRARTSWLIGGLPDLRATPEWFVCEDAAVAVRWLAEGTHHGSLNGERPPATPCVSLESPCSTSRTPVSSRTGRCSTNATCTFS